MSQFLTRCVVLTVILGAIIWGLSSFSEVHVPQILYVVVLGFFGITMFLFNSLLKANEKSPSRFVSAFMGAVAIKMMATMIFLTVYLYLNTEHRIEMAMSVFFIYISFTVLLSSSIISATRGE